MQTRPPVRITGRQFCNAFSGLRIDSKSAFYCLTGARATRLLRMGLLAASTAGDALVVGIGRGAVLWRAGTATTLRGADDERCVAVAISGDGATVATASDTKRLRCWHGDVLSEAEAPRRVSGLCIALLGDGQVLLACCAGELYAFPLPALDKPPRRLLAHTSSVLTGVSYANGLVATADRNEKVRVSQFPRCEEIESFCLGHTDFVSGVEFLSGTRLVSCGGDGYLRVWDAATGDCVAERRVGGVCTCLAVSTAAVAVATQYCLNVHVYPFVEGVLAEEPLMLDQCPDDGAPPSDLCFRGSSLVALLPGEWEGGPLVEWPRPTVPPDELSGADVEHVAGPAVQDAAAGLGAVAPSALFQALERDHAHATPARDGDDADKPSILRKHALEARYDVSQLGVVPKKQIVEDMERRRGREPAPTPESPAPPPARRRRGGRRHRRDEPESKDES